MESREAPPQTGSITVPPEAIGVSPYVFELFAGSLIYMPDAHPVARSTEFFLPQFQPVTFAATIAESPRTVEISARHKETRVPKPRPSPKIVEPRFEPQLFGSPEAPSAKRKLEKPAKTQKLSFVERLQRWLEKDTPKLDGVRRGTRLSEPGMVAFYWSGGNPKPHEVANFSKSGFYLRTRELWTLNTLVRMILQRPLLFEGDPRYTISILARVVRIDKGGVGHEFVTTDALMRIRTRDVIPDQGTDREALERFLQLQ